MTESQQAKARQAASFAEPEDHDAMIAEKEQEEADRLDREEEERAMAEYDGYGEEQE